MGKVTLTRLYGYIDNVDDALGSEVKAEFNQIINELLNNTIIDLTTTWPTAATDGDSYFHQVAEDILLDNGTIIYGLNSVEVTAGAGGVTAFDTVYVSALGAAPTVLKASNAALASCYVLGIMMQTVAEAAKGACRIAGPVRNASWAWTGVGPLYLGTSGSLTQTAPSPSGGARVIVGYPLAATSLVIRPQIVMEF